MKIVDYYDCKDKPHWLALIKSADWGAAGFLNELLSKNELKKFCGENARALLLTEENELISFCTLAEKDEVDAPEMSPWIGFVYTFPQYRGKGYAGELIDFACGEALKAGAKNVFVSTDAVGLYERYGFEYLCEMATVFGEKSRIYKKVLTN